MLTQMRMIEAGICSSHTASQVIDEFMLPLVGKQQKVFELNLENVQVGESKKTRVTAPFSCVGSVLGIWC